jgi:cytochrome c2
MFVHSALKRRGLLRQRHVPELGHWRTALFALVTSMVLLLAACQGDPQEPVEVEGGNPEHGRELIIAYQCGECHRIPGIDEAQGHTAPSLNVWPNRAFIVDSMRNTPENTAAFIQEPERFAPGIDMPNVGMTEQEALDITAYLYTLR